MPKWKEQEIKLGKVLNDLKNNIPINNIDEGLAECFKEKEIEALVILIQIIDNDIPIERLLILTNCNNLDAETSKDSALDYFKAYEGDIESCSKEYECDVWITNSDYWDDTIEFQRVFVN